MTTQTQDHQAQYIAECKRLFNATRYGWSVWEQEAAVNAYHDGVDAQDAVAEMNHQYACRKANRNA